MKVICSSMFALVGPSVVTVIDPVSFAASWMPEAVELK